MNPLDFMSYFLTLASLGNTLAESLKRFGRSDMYWEAQNTVADLRMKARGHVSPVVIERLDDGTHPEYQHLNVDFAPAFPPERIAKALHYWSSQSFGNVDRVLQQEIVVHALRGAYEGEERTATIVLTVLDCASYAVTVHGRVGGKWEVVADRRHTDRRRFFANAIARGKMQSEMRKQVRDQRKIAHKAAKVVRARVHQPKKRGRRAK